MAPCPDFFAEESSNCWWTSSWRTKITLHTQVREHNMSKCCTGLSLKRAFVALCNIVPVAVSRIVLPRFLPALSRGVLGELWPHAEDSADRVQRPQTDTHTQGGVPFHLRISKPSFSVTQHAFPWFSRVQTAWSAWSLLWTRARWWTSWRTKRATEKKRPTCNGWIGHWCV